MQWINDEAKALYDQWVAMGDDVMAKARAELSVDVSTATQIAIPRQHERIIREAQARASGCYARAVDIAVRYSMPEPMILDAKTLRPPPA